MIINYNLGNVSDETFFATAYIHDSQLDACEIKAKLERLFNTIMYIA